MAEPTDVQHLVKQLMAGTSAEENQALLEALLSGQVSSIFEEVQVDQEPTLRPVPTEVRGFRVRLDLHGAKPPVWRRLELPGDLRLPRRETPSQAIDAGQGVFGIEPDRHRCLTSPRPSRRDPASYTMIFMEVRAASPFLR